MGGKYLVGVTLENSLIFFKMLNIEVQKTHQFHT